MLNTSPQLCDSGGFPDWLPDATRHYLIHTECGVSIRELARGAGCHASTVLRQIRKTEARRDDPLLDDALAQLGALHGSENGTHIYSTKDDLSMNVQLRNATAPLEQTTIDREARRILRRLCEPSACLAVAAEMEKAVVVRETSDGRTVRTAVTDRSVVQAMALKDWIANAGPSRISRYHITTAGRAALKRLLAEDEVERAGQAKDNAVFADQHRSWEDGDLGVGCEAKSQRIRYNLAESPVSAMARRKGKDGKPFLSVELVNAAEHLREDFELAQMGLRVTQNWEQFLTSGDRSTAGDDNATGSTAAQNRVSAALRNLGPGLGDVALRVCCFLEGLETAEKRMGWSARSGKVVLRIALQRLKCHYDGLGNSGMIG